MMVDVYEKSLEPTSTIIDVTSIDDLAKLAERQGTMILHMVINFLHYYLVQNNGTTYRYMVSAGNMGIIESATVPDKVPNTIPNQFPAVESVRSRTQRHLSTVNRKNSGRPKPAQNEISEPIVYRQKNNIIQKDWVVAEEEPKYVIRTGEIEFVLTQPETELLKKVRL
jgi:hypothetical protein